MGQIVEPYLIIVPMLFALFDPISVDSLQEPTAPIQADILRERATPQQDANEETILELYDIILAISAPLRWGLVGLVITILLLALIIINISRPKILPVQPDSVPPSPASHPASLPRANGAEQPSVGVASPTIP